MLSVLIEKMSLQIFIKMQKNKNVKVGYLWEVWFFFFF